MERRSFVKRSVLATAGLMLSPLFANELLAGSFHPQSIVKLSEPVNHVRHGLMADQLTRLSGLPSWLKVGVPQRMFRNGISSASDDLVSTNILVDEHSLSVMQMGQRFHIHAAEEQYEIDNTSTEIELKPGLNISAHKLGFQEELELEPGAVLMVFEGKAQLAGGMNLNRGDAVNNVEAGRLTSLDSNTIFISINRTNHE